MASHQTFSGQFWHLTDQINFDQTNLLYIVNGEVNKFTIVKQMSRQFSTVIVHSNILHTYTIQLDSNFKNLACATAHTLHEQQKDCGVFAGAREIDEVSAARTELKKTRH